MSKKSTDWTADIAWIGTDAAAQRAAGSNVVQLQPKAATCPARRPAVRVFNELEVARRALELYDLERAAIDARAHMIDKANDFKEREGLEHVEHASPKFRRYTANALAAVVAAKGEVRKARARLETACRRCPRVRVPRLKTPTPRMSKLTVRRLFDE